jgi:hypothetical protein
MRSFQVTLKAYTSERAITSWDRLGEEGDTTWRWEILYGSHSPSQGREHGNTSSSTLVSVVSILTRLLVLLHL